MKSYTVQVNGMIDCMSSFVPVHSRLVKSLASVLSSSLPMCSLYCTNHKHATYDIDCECHLHGVKHKSSGATGETETDHPPGTIPHQSVTITIPYTPIP